MRVQTLWNDKFLLFIRRSHAHSYGSQFRVSMRLNILSGRLSSRFISRRGKRVWQIISLIFGRISGCVHYCGQDGETYFEVTLWRRSSFLSTLLAMYIILCRVETLFQDPRLEAAPAAWRRKVFLKETTRENWKICVSLAH